MAKRRKTSTRDPKGQQTLPEGQVTTRATRKRVRPTTDDAENTSKRPCTEKPSKPANSDRPKRRLAPPITDDEAPDLEEQRVLTQPRRKEKEISRQDDDHGSSGSGEESESESSEEEEDDLANIHPSCLKSTLDSERVQFGTTSLGPRPPQKSQQLKQQSSAITISSDEEEDSKGKKQGRTAKLLSEIPQWAEIEADDEPQLDTSPIISQVSVAKMNSRWPEEAHYIPSKVSTRLINLSPQPAPLQKVIRVGIHTAIERALREGFFGVDDADYINTCKLLADVSKDLEYDGLASRFQRDRAFGRDVARVIHHRLGLHRGTIKATANTLVGAHYGLELCESQDAVKERVEYFMKNANSSYIFPENNKQEPIQSKPYQHPCIIGIVKRFLFKGCSRSLRAERYQTTYASSLEKYPDQFEVPSPILALAATAIHASINDWRTGVHQPSDFTADIVEDVYAGHMKWLLELRTKSPTKYHVLTNTVFNKCQNKDIAISATIAENIRNMVNFDELEDIIDQ